MSAPFGSRLARAVRNLHVADLVVLAVVGGCVLDVSTKLLSAPNPLVQAIFIIACTAAAAKRLVAWRHGTSEPITIEGPSQMVAIVAGVAPWFLLPALHQPLHEWPLWTPVTFPPALQVIGAVLMLSGIFGPFWIALTSSGPSALAGASPAASSLRPDMQLCARALGHFLLSAKVVFGVLAIGLFAMTCCADRQLRAAPG
jgi:hypothetical protein